MGEVSGLGWRLLNCLGSEVLLLRVLLKRLLNVLWGRIQPCLAGFRLVLLVQRLNIIVKHLKFRGAFFNYSFTNQSLNVNAFARIVINRLGLVQVRTQFSFELA